MGSDGGVNRLVVFEDPQCPYCRQFEDVCGDLLRRAWEEGILAVEYRMRCFLGVESVRADNALALAAEANLFDDLRKELFSAQPQEGTGGFRTSDLLLSGQRVGLTNPEFVSGVKEGRYAAWVLKGEETFQVQDPQGTPAAWLDGLLVDPRLLSDPAALGDLLRRHQ
jgi:hypothetical protein